MLVYPLPLRRLAPSLSPQDVSTDDHSRRLRAVMAEMDDLLTELDMLGQELAAAHLATAMDHIRLRPIADDCSPG